MSMHVPQEIADTLVDPLAYADGGRIDEAFTWLRREAPLALIEAKGHNPFWAVTRHADIMTVERMNDLFLSSKRPTTVVNAAAEAAMRERPRSSITLVEMDNPNLLAHRRLTQNWFMPQNVRKLEPRIREIAREFINRMAGFGGICDFAHDVAFLYPLRVIMEILGVPESDQPFMLALTQQLYGSEDPEMQRNGGEAGQDDRSETVRDFIAYFSAITEDRRRCPRDDLATVIATGEIKGCPIGHIEAMGYYILIAAAGHDTTANSTAGGLWALAEQPGLLNRLRADPALIPAFVEEAIRWVTPVKHFMRSAAENTELSGQRIAKGDWMMLCYQSGNRDEAVFDDPFRFDIDRTPNRHISFGYGAHLCLGQQLARVEMRIFFEELFARLTSVELTGAPRRTAATFVCGPKVVPIRFTME